MTLSLRPIAKGDRAPLVALLSEIEQFNPTEVAVAVELIDGSLSDPNGSGYTCIVAEGEGRVLGYVCFGPTPLTQATFDLYWIAVAKDAQGRGVGKRLVAACEAHIRGQGGCNVRIETSSKELYAATGGFYARLGFRIAGTLPDFYAAGDDLLIFYRSIEC